MKHVIEWGLISATMAIVIVHIVFLKKVAAHDTFSSASVTRAFQQGPAVTGNYTIAAPVSKENLQIFLVLGKDDLKHKQYTTLADALKLGKVRIRETGTVNELTIDNLSNQYVYINSGDIVKGGKQDRTIGYDVILPPNGTNIPLKSFCVEQGRWQKRGNENVSNFGSSTRALSSKKLKMAAKYEGNQGKVWENVSKQQDDLNKGVSQKNGYDVNVANGTSATSLQLTLESEELAKAKKDIEDHFKGLLTKHPDAIGFAYAINGEIYGVDIYNNRKLFENLWSKLLEAVVVESISVPEKPSHEKRSASDVKSFIEAINQGTVESATKEINKHTVLKTLENKNNHVVFLTEDKEQNNWLHKNFMTKDPEETSQLKRPSNR